MTENKSGASVQHVFAGIPTADYKTALPWYERLFGRPPDVIVKDDEAMWQVASSAWVYVVADTKRAGNALLAILVEDLDASLAQLAERGIKSGAIETEPGMYRQVVVTDPDGSMVKIFENLAAD
ncbi:MAG TPA: VOC family protein [Candidatus Eremiobacteraceae bacterium]|nr:VOC family protein [Candidatus Eremiobacteraceae bacterium]